MNRRFHAGLGIILIGFCVIGGLLTYFFEKKFFADEARQKAELVMATLDSSRTYIRQVLRPKMYALVGRDHFVIEAMSTSYATRVIMQTLREDKPHFRYRRVAINARNSGYEANDFERKKIDWFRNNSSLTSWFGLVRLDGSAWYMMARPVRFKASCLHCHGRPEDAPAEVIAMYGNNRGFGKNAGQIAGLQSIAISAESQLAMMRQSAFQVFSLILLTVVFLYAVIGLLFDVVVSRKVRGVLALFQDSLLDPEGQALFREQCDGSEFQDLQASAALMAAHLRTSRLELEQYNQDLEKMVEERTEALKRSSDRLARQVRDRNRELELHNFIAELITRGEQLQRILPAILQGVLEILPATGAGIYLPNEKKQRLVLHCKEADEGLPEFLEIVSSDNQRGGGSSRGTEKLCARIAELSENGTTHGVQVPLCCRGQLLGIMLLSGIGLEDVDEPRLDLLFSVGRQAGITIESLHAVERIRESRELLQTVFDAITDPMVMVDGGGRVQMVNDAFLEKCDDRERDVIGRLLGELGIIKKIPFQLVFGKARREPVTEKYRGAGGRTWEIAVYPVAQIGKNRNAWVCLGRDVSDELLAQRRIQQAERLASVGQLAAGVAHEINNPLGVILCYTDLLRKGLPPSLNSVDDLAVIERQARSCQKIVRDLLDFARSHEPNRTPLRLQNLVDEVVEFFSTELRHRNIRVEKNIDDAFPALALDREQIRQVLVNLVLNGVQAIGQDGSLRFESEVTQCGEWGLAIEDNGCGIASEDLDRIFDPFFTTKGVDEGTGLGLSVSYGIMQDHGGRIEVHSQVHIGSRFSLIFPQAAICSGECGVPGIR